MSTSGPRQTQRSFSEHTFETKEITDVFEHPYAPIDFEEMERAMMSPVRRDPIYLGLTSIFEEPTIPKVDCKKAKPSIYYPEDSRLQVGWDTIATLSRNREGYYELSNLRHVNRDCTISDSTDVLAEHQIVKILSTDVVQSCTVVVDISPDGSEVHFSHLDSTPFDTYVKTTEEDQAQRKEKGTPYSSGTLLISYIVDGARNQEGKWGIDESKKTSESECSARLEEALTPSRVYRHVRTQGSVFLDGNSFCLSTFLSKASLELSNSTMIFNTTCYCVDTSFIKGKNPTQRCAGGEIKVNLKDKM